ncbi:class I SAM-dependent methyltransferase [Haloferula chungangensis]|uniref:Class I SAM-dependent methyltransferase n=1 Tax=Haloferula chungangensis TaxID=1048331 RepID=A0ABW2L6V4_9BACT
MNSTCKKVEDILDVSDSRISLWINWIRLTKVRNAAEVGVWKGDFASEVLRECDSIDTYYMVDPWRNLDDWNKPFNVTDEEFNEIYNMAVGATDFAEGRRKILRGKCLEVVSQITQSELDFAYVDGDHTLRGVSTDLISIWSRIRDGGAVGGDDFTDTIWQHESKYEPTLVNPFAVYFAEAANCPIFILPFNQFLILKDTEIGFTLFNLSGKKLTINTLSPVPQNMPKVESGRRNLLKSKIIDALFRLSPKFHERRIVKVSGKPFPKYIKDGKCLFIHIPKAAGSSISMGLYGRQIGHTKIKDWLNRYPSTTREIMSMAVIRDPYSRFISAFNFLKSGGMNQKDKEFSDLYIAQYQSADEFALAMIDPNMQGKILNYWHFQPQINYVTNHRGEIQVKLLIDFRALEEGLSILGKITGNDIHVAHLNKGEATSETLSEDAKKIISAIYRSDVALYREIQAKGSVLRPLEK